MPKRFTKTEIWEEDWFLQLTTEYKLLYFYIKDRCDHSGIWRVNKIKFTQSTPGQIRNLHLDDFLRAVNTDDDGEMTNRIIDLGNKKWFIVDFITTQYGSLFKPKIGAHRGFLKLLVMHNIPFDKVPDFDFMGLQNVDRELVKKLVYDRSNYTLYEDYLHSILPVKEKEEKKKQEKEQENNNYNKVPPDFSAKENGLRGAHMEQEYGNPGSVPADFDWEFQKKAFLQDRNWVDRMALKFFKDEEGIQALLSEFLEHVEDSNDKKTARLLWRWFPQWVPKKEYWKQKLKDQTTKDPKRLEGKQDFKNMKKW